MIAAGKQIKEMVVMKYAGGFYTVRYRDTGGGLRVRESRLYATKAEAEKAGYVKPGELAVITAGVPLGISGTTNMLKVCEVGNRY